MTFKNAIIAALVVLLSALPVRAQNISTTVQKVVQTDSSGTAVTPSTDATTNTTAQATGPQWFCNASAATPTAVGADGRSIATWCTINGSLHVTLDNSVTAGVVGLVAHDAVGTAIAPLLFGGYASAAAPTDVSADGDAVRAWFLRNGSQVVNIAAAGNLIGATSNAMNVNATQATGTNLHMVCDSGCGSGTQYTEDAAAAADPVGTVHMLVRKDTPAATVSADGDNIAQRGTNYGAAYATLLDASGNVITPSTDATTNTASQTTGPQVFCNGSTATPTTVGADGRSISVWCGPNGQVKVDGSAVTQPVSGTVTANMGTVTADPFGANADAASATGSISAKLRFIAATGIPVTGTVTVGSHAVTNAGTFATQSAVTAASGAIASGAVASGAFASGSIASGAVASGAFGSDSASFGVSATGAAPPAKANYTGGLGSGATGGFLIGVPVCDSFKAVSMTSATTTLMVTGVSGRHVRICSINLVTAIANNVVLISGTGATCGTGTAGIMGGTTAANGWNFAANGGIALGSGLGTVMQTAATGDSVCIITSAAGPLAGTIAYAIY